MNYQRGERELAAVESSGDLVRFGILNAPRPQYNFILGIVDERDGVLRYERLPHECRGIVMLG